MKPFETLRRLFNIGVALMMSTAPAAPAVAADAAVSYGFANVDGHRVFYREAGDRNAPAILLLHGFPTSSHVFRDLMPRLATTYHVIAPDLPGFGLTEMAKDKRFVYTFDGLTQVIDRFTEVKGLGRYAMYVFDYGAPVGWRLAVAHPERISAIISQNGNAYEEGLSSFWAPIRAYWADPTPQNRSALKVTLRPETTRWQYLEGVEDPGKVAPEAYLLDQLFLDRPGQEDIQLDLCLDYRTNVARYPVFQQYFRDFQPPLLAVWGANDPFFLPVGAESFRRDLPNAEIHLLPDAGHFALEVDSARIAGYILDFLGRLRSVTPPRPAPSPPHRSTDRDLPAL